MGYDLVELEEQKKWTDRSTLVDKRYINSAQYRRKFDLLSDDTKFVRLLFDISKKMLMHRSGTIYEDMYWIDPKTISIVAQKTDSIIPKKIRYSFKIKRIIKKYEGLITIHTHPDSFPPSIEDFISNFEHNYGVGLVICHNGQIYKYYSGELINKAYCEMVLADFLKDGYNEIEAQARLIEHLKNKFDIKCEEVIGDDI